MHSNALSILQVLFFLTLSVVAWVAVRRPAPSPAVVLRLSLAALLATAAVNLAGVSPTAAASALALQFAALAVAVHAAGLLPLRLRRIPNVAPISFEDFRRVA